MSSTRALTGRQERAAWLVAEDRLSDQAIAEQLRVTRQTLVRWRTQPPFQARVAEHQAAIRQTVLTQGIADVVQRVRALNDRWERLRRVIHERSQDPSLQEIPGGATGLLVRTLKMVGTGPNAQIIEEYGVDTGLLAELRAHEQQAAKELGQWTERTQHVGSDGRPIPGLVITIVDQRSPGGDAPLGGAG